MSRAYTIRINPSIIPVQHAHRKVLIDYREQIECTLNEMVEKGVIAPVSQPTECVSSLRYPCKPDGTLSICLDPKDLNKAIVWEHYKAPTLDDISHHLSGASCFSKLGTKDGFWSIHLEEKSLYFTTFNTHCGRFRFLHMTFGLKMSQDVFQMWMDQATECLPGIITIHDDICIYGHTSEEHDQHLLELMEPTKEHGIIFNSTKHCIRQPQIAFYGTLFTAQGMPTGSCQNPSPPRPSYPWLPGSASVLPRTDKLPSAIQSQPVQ